MRILHVPGERLTIVRCGRDATFEYPDLTPRTVQKRVYMSSVDQ